MSTCLTSFNNNKIWCTLIFFEGTQVSSIMEGLFVNKENYIVKTKDGTKDDWAKVILKVKKPSPYSVMVIANSSKSFAGCQSENNIKDIIQDDKDALVKVGKMDISFDTDFAGYPTIAEALGNTSFSTNSSNRTCGI